MGSVLSIKPILDMSTGEVHEAAKPRTKKKGLLWLRDKVARVRRRHREPLGDGR